MYVASVASKIFPDTAGGFAGATVYPRSPMMDVPLPLLVYVLARMPKVPAAPRFADVAAKALFCIIPVAENISTDITKILFTLFLIIVCLLLV